MATSKKAKKPAKRAARKVAPVQAEAAIVKVEPAKPAGEQ